jgi:hypothetical protein
MELIALRPVKWCKPQPEFGCNRNKGRHAQYARPAERELALFEAQIVP